MLFIPLPKLPPNYQKKIWNFYLQSRDKEFYKHKETARVTNVFICKIEDQCWIYNSLVKPLGIPREQIKNQYIYKDHKCCGMNFSVFQQGDWCYPHQDLNLTKIHFFWHGDCKTHSLFWPKENTYWDYSSPAVIDVSKKHTVTHLDKLTTPRIMFQVFLTEKIEYYAELLKRKLNKDFKWES